MTRAKRSKMFTPRKYDMDSYTHDFIKCFNLFNDRKTKCRGIFEIVVKATTKSCCARVIIANGNAIPCDT